ncbi:MAG: hypothetical protein ACOYO1_18930, partial [Bacteroidales bacterium]
NPILIKLDEQDNYLDFENFVVFLKALSSGKHLCVKQKGLKQIEGKYYDILYVEEISSSEKRIKFRLVFDVTECLGKNYDFISKHIQCPNCGGQADADGDVFHQSIFCYYTYTNEKLSIVKNKSERYM